jgi:hypothetical protein
MSLLPLRVLLLSGGEPSFFNDAQHGEELSENSFLQIDTVKTLPAPQTLESGPWQICVLPCEAYLFAGSLPPGVPVIVYGASTLARSCLEAGASDFMRPGWSWLELEARLFRYSSPELIGNLAVYTLWGLTLVKRGDLRTGDFSPTTETGLRLSSREALALRLLLYREGRVLPYSTLNNLGGGDPGASHTSPKTAVAMAMSRLRKKLASLDPGLAKNLRSARGQGYLWVEDRIGENQQFSIRSI